MRISDWSSDVFSSDLALFQARKGFVDGLDRLRVLGRHGRQLQVLVHRDGTEYAPFLGHELDAALGQFVGRQMLDLLAIVTNGAAFWLHHPHQRLERGAFACAITPQQGHHLRSEAHTSELQSLMRNSYAVFCLKKKKNYI